MKLWKPIILIAALALAACAGDRSKIVGSLTLLVNSLELTVAASDTALMNGVIDWHQACKVDQYTRLARSFAEQGFIAVVDGDLETAAGLLDAAQNASIGVGAEVVALVADQCSGDRA